MVDYKDFFDSADQLLKRGSSEMDLRNSMSRAYYGLYHLALDYADSVAIPKVSSLQGATHEKLSAFYVTGKHTDQALHLKMRGIGYSLKQCHRARCKADYQIGDDVSVLEAEAHYKACETRKKDLLDLQQAAAA